MSGTSPLGRHIGGLQLLVLLLESLDGVENIAVELGSVLSVLHEDLQEVLMENPQSFIL